MRSTCKRGIVAVQGGDHRLDGVRSQPFQRGEIADALLGIRVAQRIDQVRHGEGPGLGQFLQGVGVLFRSGRQVLDVGLDAERDRGGSC